MNITYRTGRKEDCPKLAELVYIASDGVVEFLFHELIPHEGGAYLMRCPVE
jgi:hypothetical protein